MDNPVLDTEQTRLVQLHAELNGLELVPLLEKLRERFGLSANKLAEAAGMDQGAFGKLLRGENRNLTRKHIEHVLDELQSRHGLGADERAVWRRALRVARYLHLNFYKIILPELREVGNWEDRARLAVALVRKYWKQYADDYDESGGLFPAFVPALPLADEIARQLVERYGWARIPRGFELSEAGPDEMVLVRGRIMDPAEFGPEAQFSTSEPGRYLLRRKGAAPRAPAEPKARPPEPPPDHTPERRTARFIEPELIHIPAGEFWMGSDERDQDASEDEKPLHRVWLPGYWIARFPVTNEEYQAFLDDNPTYPVEFRAERCPADKPRHPVVRVTWLDALAYCRWLVRLTGREYTLPSEAEWEKAARGPDYRVYPWGNHWDDNLCTIGDVWSVARQNTTPVGHYSPRGDSPYGVADMVGNVWEVTRSKWYQISDMSEYRRSLNNYPVREPRFRYPYDPRDKDREDLQAEGFRVVRGGSFRGTRSSVGCARRGGGFPAAYDDDCGFRVAIVSASSF